MTITLINGCVLFPHRYAWRSGVNGKRTWQTEIDVSVPGAEIRHGLRAAPRRQMSCTVTATTLQERVRLEARIDAAKKSGFACAPLRGRACLLTAPVAAGANSITQDGSAWNWRAGDYAILLQDDQTFDVAAVVNVAGNVLTLAINLTFNWPAQTQCWPVIFGGLTIEKEEPLANYVAAWKLTIAELTSGRSVQIGALPAQPPGIGKQRIGKTNQVI